MLIITLAIYHFNSVAVVMNTHTFKNSQLNCWIRERGAPEQKRERERKHVRTRADLNSCQDNKGNKKMENLILQSSS